MPEKQPPVPSTALKRAAASSFREYDPDASDSTTESESETERLERYPAKRRPSPRKTASRMRQQLYETRLRAAGKKALKVEMEGEGRTMAYRTRSAAAVAATEKKGRVKLEAMPDLKEAKPEADNEDGKPGTGQVFLDGADAESNWDRVMRARRETVRLTEIDAEPVEVNTSDKMGLFASLPGELRNRMNRFALVEGDGVPFLVSMEKLTCNLGACIHMRMPTALPGILSACKQIRGEAMPIFIAENSFKFDDELVKARCVANWLRVIGPYAELLSKVVLDIVLWEVPLAVRTTSSEKTRVHYEMGLRRKKDGRWLLHMDREIMLKATNESSVIDSFVDTLNREIENGEKAPEVALREFVWSDWLAKLVYLCRK